MFLGTPADAVPTLRGLHAAGYEIALAVTNPDARRGRGGRTTPTPVKAAALELGIAVSHDLSDALLVEADLGVVVAFGQIIPSRVLRALPMINLHFSLLPRWRGAAPVERAILAGDDLTGVCVMAVDRALDTGDVYATAKLPLGSASTAAAVRATLADRGAALLVEALDAGLANPVPQSGDSTYAPKLGPEDLHIDWGHSTEEISRQVRVGGAWTSLRGRRFKVTTAAPLAAECSPVEGLSDATPGEIRGDVVRTGDGALQLLSVQPEGKPVTEASAWLLGARLESGEAFK